MSVVLGPWAEQRSDGSLRNQDGRVYPAGTWYTTELESRGCACMAGTCFLKCCAMGEIMFWKKRRCGKDKVGQCWPSTTAVPDASLGPTAAAATTAAAANVYANVTLVVDLYSLDNLATPLKAAVPPPPEWNMLFTKPETQMLRLEPHKYSDDMFYLLANGSLWVPGHNNESVFRPSQFCMDVFDDELTRSVSALVPFPEQADQAQGFEDVQDTINSAGLLISLPFLMTTFTVYATLGELQNLHGKSLLCHVGAMTLAFVDLLLVKFMIGADNLFICKFLGFFLQFAFLACFFWLNVMCVDIWMTFSGFRSVHGSPSWSSGERKRFRAYSLYAWGGPLVILAVTVAVQVAGDCLELPAWVVRPDVGVYSCYLGSTAAKYAYFVGPVAVLLLCNVVLFVYTAIRILQISLETSALRGAESQRHSDEKHRYFVYLKLFVTMGGNWIAEIVSGVVPDYTYLWLIMDVTNSLQGIVIFVMCVGTGHVRGLVLDRLFRRKPQRHASSQSSTRTTNTTRVKPVAAAAPCSLAEDGSGRGSPAEDKKAAATVVVVDGKPKQQQQEQQGGAAKPPADGGATWSEAILPVILNSLWSNGMNPGPSNLARASMKRE